jgi:uncharacterized protein (TIGR02678 family)
MINSKIETTVSQVEENTRHERKRALRALLQNPLLFATGKYAEEFGLVRRHSVWLKEWLMRNAGWPLQVESEFARLRKFPGVLSDDTRPLTDPATGLAFSRRRYVIFCLALAVLERSDRQTTLAKIAEGIKNLVAAEPELSSCGIEFTLTGQDERRDVVAVIRRLIEYQALNRVQGDEQQFIIEKGDVLYNVNRPILTSLLIVRRGPSTITATDFENRLSAITDESIPSTDDAQNRRIRSFLTRRLLDDPTLYYDTLTPEEMSYLNNQRSHVIGQIQDATGLIAEVRREGIAMVDEDGELTDFGIPEEGTDGHLTLLVAEHLSKAARQTLNVSLGRASLQSHIHKLIKTYGAHWRKDVTRAGAEMALTSQILNRLEALGLVRMIDEGVVPLPAIARYSVKDYQSRVKDKSEEEDTT